MTVATLCLELRLGGCLTLREKRRRIRAIMSKLHRHFNVSVAEAERDHDPAHATLVAAAVGRSRRDARDTLMRVADAVAGYPRAELLSQALSEV
jgi:uncharacterized protein YlxP (DUF503 family)